MQVSLATVQWEQERTLARIAYLQQRIDQRTAQIAEAESRGLTAFDHERFMGARVKSKEI